MYEPGTQHSIKGALEAGATIGEITGGAQALRRAGRAGLQSRYPDPRRGARTRCASQGECCPVRGPLWIASSVAVQHERQGKTETPRPGRAPRTARMTARNSSLMVGMLIGRVGGAGHSSPARTADRGGHLRHSRRAAGRPRRPGALFLLGQSLPIALAALNCSGWHGGMWARSFSPLSPWT